MEVNTIPGRPSQVTKAVYILYFSLGLVTIRAFLDLSISGGKFSEGIAVLVQLPLFALLYYVIGKGKNWARITFCVLTFLGILLFAVQFLKDPPGSNLLSFSKLSLDIAGMVLDLIALVLLFQPVSSEWFKDVSDVRSNSSKAMSMSWRKPFKTILHILRNTDQPVLSYVWQAWLIGFIPTIAIGTLVGLTMPDKVPSIDGTPGSMFYKQSPITIVLSAVVLGPWMETCLMWPILGILKRIIRKTLWVAAASALVWGVLHSTVAPAWGLGIAWPFFVFSLCFLEWSKISTGWAITATALVHMLHNAVPILVVVLLLMFGFQAPHQKTIKPNSARNHIEAPVSVEKKTSTAQPSVQGNPTIKTKDPDKEAGNEEFQKVYPELGIQ
jgi:hypothetical protein